MEIAFNKKKLADWANDDKKGRKKLGEKRFKKYRRRLALMREADNLEALRNAPGRFHELTGDRKGEWACDLDHPYRLIFTPQERPIPENEDGQYIWIEIKAVLILSIEDYH